MRVIEIEGRRITWEHISGYRGAGFIEAYNGKSLLVSIGGTKMSLDVESNETFDKALSAIGLDRKSWKEKFGVPEA